VTFTDENYRAMSDEMRRSAEVAVPVIIRWLLDHRADGPSPGQGWAPERAIDVGCGPGWWAVELRNDYCSEVLGLDGPDGGKAITAQNVPLLRFAEADLAGHWLNTPKLTPTELPIIWDLALCLEVGEHLPVDRAQSLVENLRCVAPVVVFSAAIPGQGGVGHVNERWPDWWASMFRDSGWRTSGAIRRHLWNLDGLAPYYAQNIFVAWEPGRLELPYGTEIGQVDALVHPGVWSHVTGRG
jgi:SAM-dependent methyltransferase